MVTQAQVEKQWEARGRGLYRGGAWITSTTSDDVADGLATKLNERAELIAALENIADKMGRASLVQDRSVRIIKQVCALIAKDARALLDKVNKQ